MPRRLTEAPVRVRGIVRSEGRGLPHVAISDGLTVVDTGTDGTFELLTSSDREFVFASIPSGFRIPTSRVGTATAYAEIPRVGRDETTMDFDLEPLAGSDDEHTMLLLPDVQAQDRYRSGCRQLPRLSHQDGQAVNSGH